MNQGLKPLSVGETLDTAIKLYRSHARLLWQAVAVIVIPLQIVELLIHNAAIPRPAFVSGGTLYTANGTTGGAVPTISIIVISALVDALTIGAVYTLVLDSYMGRRPDLRKAFDVAGHKAFPLVLVSVLVGLAVAIGFILIIVPGIWLLVSLCVAIPVLMQEDLRGTKALSRSRELVQDRWWATFGRLLILVIILAVTVLITAGLASALSVSSVFVWLLVNAILSSLLLIIATPFSASMITVMYIDLRVRKEALDLELLAGGSPEPAPATTGG
jgi:hypothetical protein